jgi:hypothetical protein
MNAFLNPQPRKAPPIAGVSWHKKKVSLADAKILGTPCPIEHLGKVDFNQNMANHFVVERERDQRKEESFYNHISSAKKMELDIENIEDRSRDRLQSN